MLPANIHKEDTMAKKTTATAKNEAKGTKDSGAKKRAKKKVRVLAAMKVEDFGPDLEDNDILALKTATRLEMTADGTDNVIRAIKEAKKDSGPWSGTEDLYRAVEVGLIGDGKAIASEIGGSHSSRVIQSIFTVLKEMDRIALETNDDLILLHVLKKGDKRCLSFIIGTVA